MIQNEHAFAPVTELLDHFGAPVDEKTLTLLERRRAMGPTRRRGWLVRRSLMAADLVGLLAAFVAATLIVSPAPRASDPVGGELEWVLFLVSLPLWVFVAKLYGLYDRDEERTDHTTVDDLIDVFHMVTVGAWVLLAVTWFSGAASPDLTRLVFFWLMAVGLVTLGRATARSICRRQVAYLQNAVIVGAGEVGQLVGRKLLQHPEYGVNLVGFVDSAPKERRADLGHLTLLGSPEELPQIVKRFDIERVVVAFSNETHEDLLGLIRSLKSQEIQIDIVPRLFDIVGPSIDVHTVEGLPLIGLRPPRLGRSSQLVKRLMDIALSFSALLILSPLFVAVAAAIKLESPGPIFFRQVRMGMGDRTFRIFKFRTMVDGAEERKDEIAHLNKHALPGGDPRMFKAPDDPRVTRLGKLLRAYSIDELPQLFNVIKGEMSLVGPRPLILSEDDHVTEEWARSRLRLRPGMTGVWQVLGRSDIPFEEMTKLDYLYVTNWSLRRDLSLILRTIPAVLRSGATY